MRVRIETAKDGHEVPVIDTDEKLIHLGSMYDGREAARIWCDENLTDDRENLILVGLGDCQIALEARRRLKGHVYIYEPEKGLFDLIKSSKVYKKLIRSGNVDVSTYIDMTEKWMADLFNEDTLETSTLFVHPGYRMGRWDDQIDHLKEALNEKLKEMIDFRTTLIVIAYNMSKNVMKNIPQMKGSVLLSRLQNEWDPKLPFILVGAGPSLNKNVEQLKNVGNKACIVCLDTAYRILKKNGVRPHMVATLDAGKPLEVFGELDEWDDTPLAVICNARPEIIKKTNGPVIWCMESNSYTREIRGRIGGDDELFPLTYGVSSLGMAIPLSLGASQIVFVGMDLAFSPDGASHAGVFKNEQHQDDLFQVEGYYGGIVNTRTDWKEMREWIESIVEEDSYGRYINCTEGGCKIKGVPQMSLEKAISFLKEPEEDWYSLFTDKKTQISDIEYNEMMERYEESFKDFCKIKNTSYENIFYNKRYQDKPIFHLLMSIMKSRHEETRAERFEKAVEVLDEMIGDLQKENDI